MGSARNKRTRAASVAPPASGFRWWHYALAVAAFVYLAFQVYAPTLESPFLFDDQYLPFALPYFGENPLRLWIGGVRPALMFGFWLNYQIAGQDTFWYHVVNVLFHVFNAGLVFLIVRKLLQLAGETRESSLVALFAAALFLLHPVQTESVSYVASRSENQSTAFYYGAAAVFLYRRQQAIGWRRTGLVLLLFLLAIATKEHAITLPALLLLTDYFWNPGFSFQGIRRNWRLYVSVIAGGLVAGNYILSRIGDTAAAEAGFGLKGVAWYQYLFTQFEVFFIYLRLFVLPANLTVDYDHAFVRSVFELSGIFWLVILLATLALAWIYRRRYPLAAFGLFAVVLLLAPTSSILPIRDPIAERRMYLPMIGYLLIVVEFLRRFRLRRLALLAGMGAILVMAAAATYARNQVWSGPVPFWEDAAKKAPNKRRPRFQLAFAYYEAGRCGDAVREYGEVARIEPPNYELLVDWALAYDCLQQFDEAVDKLRQAAALEPRAHVYSLIGMVYAKQARWDQALEALGKAEELDPRFAMTFVYRANAYLARGRPDLAATEFERALAIEPQNQMAHEGLVKARRMRGAPR
jgi:tetratricopeptide (TPR) repeat protein